MISTHVFKLLAVAIGFVFVAPPQAVLAQNEPSLEQGLLQLLDELEHDPQSQGAVISCEPVLAFSERFNMGLGCVPGGYITVHELTHAALNFLDEYTEQGFESPQVRVEYVAIISQLGWVIHQGLLAARCAICDRER